MVGKHIVITSHQITVPHCPSIPYEWEASPRNAINKQAYFTLTPKPKNGSAKCFVVGPKIEMSLTQGLFSDGNLAYDAFKIFTNNESLVPLQYEGFNAFIIDPERLSGYDDRFSIAAIRNQIQSELRHCKIHATVNDIANRVDAFCTEEYSATPYNSSVGASILACTHELLKGRLSLLRAGNCSKGASLMVEESEFAPLSSD